MQKKLSQLLLLGHITTTASNSGLFLLTVLVVWSVRLCVCLLVMFMIHAKIAKATETPFNELSRWVQVTMY